MDDKIRRATVCFIRENNKLLLALIEYHPNDRQWNGIGGFAEVGESLEDGLIREFQEETFIKLDKNKLKKVVEFNGSNPFYVFLTDTWSGELKIKEPSLKELRWFSINNLPYSQMYLGTKAWLPKVLEGKLLKDMGNGLIEVTKFD